MALAGAALPEPRTACTSCRKTHRTNPPPLGGTAGHGNGTARLITADTDARVNQNDRGAVLKLGYDWHPTNTLKSIADHNDASLNGSFTYDLNDRLKTVTRNDYDEPAGDEERRRRGLALHLWPGRE